MKSPCIKLCKLDKAGKYCVGCFRTIDEISNWMSLTEYQQSKIIEKLRKRKNDHVGNISQQS